MKRTRSFVTTDERLSRLKAKKAQGRGAGWWQPIGNLAQICTVGVVLFGNFYRPQPMHGKEFLDEEIAAREWQVSEQKRAANGVEATLVALQAAIANLQRERDFVLTDLRELNARLAVTETALASERARFRPIAEEVADGREQVAREQRAANAGRRTEPGPRDPKEAQGDFQCLEYIFSVPPTGRIWDAAIRDFVTVEEWCLRQSLMRAYASPVT
jgi:hypothetical protein